MTCRWRCLNGSEGEGVGRVVYLRERERNSGIELEVRREKKFLSTYSREGTAWKPVQMGHVKPW